MNKYRVAIAGADSMVGGEIIRILEQREFPVSSLRLLANNSQLKSIKYQGEEIPLEDISHTAFKDVDIAFFTAGVDATRHFALSAVKDGALVIDNSDEYRLDSNYPLVVPEVNPEDIKGHKGIIVNPNSIVVQLVMALHPLEKANHIQRVTVATYQAVSDMDSPAVDELTMQTRQVLNGEQAIPHTFTHRIAFNVLPQIDVFYDSGYSKEEVRLINESRKIMHVENIAISATCVRVPVFTSHCEAVQIEFTSKMTADEVTNILRKSPGIRIEDEPTIGIYPQPFNAAGIDEVVVGRIRRDLSNPNGIAMFIVADNIRRGGALNMVRIAEETITRNWLK